MTMNNYLYFKELILYENELIELFYIDKKGVVTF